MVEKKFDCVEMKERIQEHLLREYEGLSAEEVRRKRLENLASGESPAARIWQAGLKRGKILSR